MTPHPEERTPPPETLEDEMLFWTDAGMAEVRRIDERIDAPDAPPSQEPREPLGLNALFDEMDAPPTDEGVRCGCEWQSPENGEVDAKWPAVLDPYCPVHTAEGAEERVWAAPPPAPVSPEGLETALHDVTTAALQWAEEHDRVRERDPITDESRAYAASIVDAVDTLNRALAALSRERDEAVQWIGVVRDELVLAGYPGGDRTVALQNIREELRALAAARAEVERKDAALREIVDCKVSMPLSTSHAEAARLHLSHARSVARQALAAASPTEEPSRP